MRILQITHKPPFPPVDGGCIAMHHITSGLQQAGHKVKLLTLHTHKHPLQIQRLPKAYLESSQVEGIYADTRIKPLAALGNLFSSNSYHVSRFYVKMFEELIVRTLREKTFDVIHLESLYCSPYLSAIQKETSAPVILRAHNVEHKIWEQLTENTGNPVKKWYLGLLAKRLKTFEESHLNKFDGIAAISNDDAERFKEMGCTIPIEVLPTGLDLARYRANKGSVKNLRPAPALFYLGALDWQPNSDGLEWFIGNCWHQILAQNPSITLLVAGRKAPSWIQNINEPGITYVGEVKDALDYIRSNGVMIVPLRSGSGIRIKILEGMALGKTIITTDIGAEGLPCEHGENILIANSVDDWVQQIDELIKHSGKVDKIGKAASQFVANHFDNGKITNRLVQFYKSLKQK